MSVGFIFTETKNRWRKKDGDEFKGRANDLHKLWEDDPDLARSELFLAGNTNKKGKRDLVSRTLRRTGGLKRLAFFCHGWPSGISLGYSVWDVPWLAKAIAAACESNVIHIGLFACSTGRGRFWGGKKRKINMINRDEKIVTPREGFAMYLCSELAKLGIHAVITAHLTSGHTTRNPYKVRIEKRNGRITRVRMCPSTPKDKWRAWIKNLSSNVAFAFEAMLDRKHG